MTQYYYRDGPPGCGKSYLQFNDAVSTPTRYLIAIETTERYTEVLADLRRFAVEQSTNPVIKHIASIQPGSVLGNSTNVRADIEALPLIHGRENHVIVVITHAALLTIDTSEFGSWVLVVDEVPQIFKMELFQSEASVSWLRNNFDLTECAENRSSVRLASGAVTRPQLARDTAMSTMVAFYSAVASPTTDVFVDLTDWEAAGIDQVRWTWWAFWRLEQLDGFSSVTFLANGFLRSTFARVVLNASPDVEFNRLATPSRGIVHRRAATVTCFARRHELRKSSYATIDEQQGLRPVQANLVAIAAYLADRVDPSSHIWSSNEALRQYLGDVPGTWLSPRQAGSNRYQATTACTMLYAAKPRPSEIGIYAERGVGADDITAEREIETIIQMMTRTAVRDHQSIANLNYYVYDLVQAEALAAYLRSTGYVDVAVKVVDLGYADFVISSRPGRKTLERTPAEAALHADTVREVKRLKIAAERAARRLIAPPKPRGRPRIVAGGR